jgi:hypothetical protein
MQPGIEKPRRASKKTDALPSGIDDLTASASASTPRERERERGKPSTAAPIFDFDQTENRLLRRNSGTRSAL